MGKEETITDWSDGSGRSIHHTGHVLLHRCSRYPCCYYYYMAIAIYAMTLAPVTWVILSEIFPNSIRGTAMAIATTSLWIACFILTYTFPWLNKLLNASGTFWLYALICLIGFLYIRRNLVETKGKTLEEVEKLLTKK